VASSLTCSPTLSRGPAIPLFNLKDFMSLVFAATAPVSCAVTGTNDRYPVRRVYCVGRNYAEHAKEMGFSDREPPFFFMKPADSLVNIAAGETGEIPYAMATSNMHHEIELVVAIGKQGKRIKSSDAQDYIWGYAVGLDMTRRDCQFQMRDKGRPWEIGKGFDQSAPIGPITPVSASGELTSGNIKLDVNGKTRQTSDLSKLTWNVNETIEHLSNYFELFPGDLIFTGTPEGVAAVVSGDLLQGSIDKLGSLNVRIGAAA
jgi:fumarylpyruvate hydrolase